MMLQPGLLLRSEARQTEHATSDFPGPLLRHTLVHSLPQGGGVGRMGNTVEHLKVRLSSPIHSVFSVRRMILHVSWLHGLMLLSTRSHIPDLLFGLIVVMTHVNPETHLNTS